MKALEIVVIVLSILFVLGVIIKSIIDKKKGKNNCQCGCSNCKYANNCKNKK